MTTPCEHHHGAHSHEACRHFDVHSVRNLVEVLKSKIDFKGQELPKRPWEDDFSLPKLKEAFESGVHELPHEYIDTYAKPLEAALPRLAAQATSNNEQVANQGRRDAETLIGAVYCHAHEDSVTRPLHRLMAVTSFLFRSFVNAEKLAHFDIDLVDALPPLATLKQWGGTGPFTLTVKDVRRLIGPQASVGVVSIPAVMREHPVLWGILGHEVGGHDVQHAAPGLIQELSIGIRDMFEELARACARAGNDYGAELNLFFGKLWSWWTNEAAADVFGILNIGPVFVFSLNAKLQAKLGSAVIPLDTMYYDQNRVLGSHPLPVLRIHLGIGVVQSLPGLNPQRCQQYVEHMRALAALSAGGAKTVKIRGLLQDTKNGHVDRVDREIPLELMQLSAISVGRYIARAPLNTFKGRNVQCIETWEDGDELITSDLIEAMREHQCSLPIGDPSHIISAGAAEMFNNPDLYDETNRYIGEGLDRCFSRDPIWEGYSRGNHESKCYLY